MRSTVNEPTFVFDDLPLHWQMTRCEKYALAALLDATKPETAIEIGTYRGGSLQLIAARARHVYSLDIDPACRESLGPRFGNVEFLVGDSRDLIAGVLEEIRDRGQSLGFVLVDGDHSADGVRRDAEALLRMIPARDVTLMFHDSFNPDVRAGLLAVDWANCPFVEYVELDFIPGVFHRQAFDTAVAGSMWGGFAVARLSPVRRKDDLIVHQSQSGLFDIVRRQSQGSVCTDNS